jgi:hypothetical protein
MMVVVGSLTIRRVQRHTLADGRRLPPTQSIEYFQPDRKREEHRGHAGYRIGSSGRDLYRLGPRTALIHRYDLRQVFLVNFDDGEYTAWPIEPVATAEQWRTRAVAIPESQRVPTVLVETETANTGEQKELFGRPARHVVTTRRVIPLTKSSCQESKTVTDGWYIDLDTSVSHDPPWWSSRSSHAFLTIHQQGEQRDVPTFKDIGEPERGYPLISRRTTSGSVDELEVTHLSTVAIDPSVFDMPANFRLVEQIRQDPAPPFVIRVYQAYERLKRALSSHRKAGD